MPPFALSPPHLWVGSCKDRPARRGGVRRRLLTWVRYTSPPLEIDGPHGRLLAQLPSLRPGALGEGARRRPRSTAPSG